MRRQRAHNRGFYFVEWALILGIFVVAVTTMTLYARRSYQGKIKAVADGLAGSIQNLGINKVPQQYEPYYASSDLTTTQNIAERSEAFRGGATRKTLSRETIGRSGTLTQGTDQTQGNVWNVLQ